MNIECIICNKLCKNYKSLTSHLRVHKITSKDYYDKYLKTEEPICPMCGKETKFICITNGYHKYCSLKCSANSSETREKYKKTNIEIYGVNNPTQSLEVRNKSEQTNFKKYGFKNPFQVEEFKEKSKQTMIKNHGVEYPSQSKEIRERQKQTCLKKYGVKYPAQSEKIKEKTKQTCLEKFNVECSFQSKEVQEKFRVNFFKKHGVENPFQLEDIKEKSKKTMLKNHGVEYATQSPEILEKMKEKYRQRMINRILKSDRLKGLVKPNFNIDEYKNITTKYSWKCLQCNNIFEDDLDDGKVPRCPTCYPFFEKLGTSKQEKEIIDFCKIYYSNLKENNRTILLGKELDVYIPELNLAIEFDGLYWHSESIQKDKIYHLNKTLECKKQNIQLIHIFEDEWFNKQEIVKSMLLNKMNKTPNKIYTRKCKIKEVNSEDSINFLEENHIQGNINSKIRLGLYHNLELVSLLTLDKSRYNKEFEYEIYRFCNKLTHNIPGSFSKLLKYFKENYSPKSIITYSDKRFGEGLVYEKNNFKFSHSSDPNYYYMKNYSTRQPRIKYQKHKLENILEIFDPTLTEWENMQLNGFDRIWDCGNNVWTWTN